MPMINTRLDKTKVWHDDDNTAAAAESAGFLVDLRVGQTI